MILLIFIFFSVACSAQNNTVQYFSGTVTYQNYYFTSSGQNISDQISKVYGGKQKYHISDNKYKIEMDTGVILTQIYDGDSNLLYMALSDKTMKQIDASMKNDSVAKILYFDTDTLIAGQACKKMSINCMSGTYLYYYAPDIVVDRELYRRHYFGNWNVFLDATRGALPMLTVIKMPQIIICSVATEVRRHSFTDDFFSVKNPKK